MKGQLLDRLLAGYVESGKQNLEMQVPDGLAGDRHAWAVAAGAHGREVYRDDDNDTDAQLQRVSILTLLSSLSLPIFHFILRIGSEQDPLCTSPNEESGPLANNAPLKGGGDGSFSRLAVFVVAVPLVPGAIGRLGDREI